MVSYDDVVAAAFAPSPEGADAAVNRSPQRRFRDAIEPLAMHVVWSRLTNERLEEHGLDFRTGYVWGRAAALGLPEPGVVVSSFAVFEPGMISAAYLAGRAACDRDTLLRVRTEATTQSLKAVLGSSGVADPSEVAGAVAALRDAVAACDRVGRPIFSGLWGREWPEDPIGQLWHGCELLREYRGDSHVAVCVERGVGSTEMNILTELWLGMSLGSYSATRGWTEDQLGGAVSRLIGQGLMKGSSLTSAGRAFREEIEQATDRLCVPITEAVSAKLVDLLDGWSAHCVAAGAFPPDVFKRAAG